MVQKPKHKGGLGVINLRLQNDALLLEQLHKFYNQLDIPWINLIWQRYYNGRVPQPRQKQAPSGGKMFYAYRFCIEGWLNALLVMGPQLPFGRNSGWMRCCPKSSQGYSLLLKMILHQFSKSC
jgi:hypothetical protein